MKRVQYVIDDRLVVIFKDDMLNLALFYLLAVDALALVFALTERSDVEIVLQNFAYGYDRLSSFITQFWIPAGILKRGGKCCYFYL